MFQRILLVTGDGERSGAPVLALALIEDFGARVEVMELAGRRITPRAVVDRAARDGADAIVLGLPRSRRWSAGLLRRRVLRRAALPVVLAPPGATADLPPVAVGR